jgi:hypothetical protein
MERYKFNNEIGFIMNKVSKVLESKGNEYQADLDVFSNFKTNAEKLGMSPYQIWAIYFNKHVESINNAIKKSPNNPDAQELAEPFEGRIVDAIAYLLLLNGMTKQK